MPLQPESPPPSFLPAPAPDFEHDEDLEPPTPRSPVSDMALARAAQPRRQGNNGRGALVLIVVLVLLIIVGSSVGFLLFRLFINNG
jgi:hypothetical protein